MNYKHYNTPYTPKEKEKALTLWRNSSIEFVCHRYHCSERSLWRWKRKYNGTLDSLVNGSHRPHSKHPNAHNAFEIKHIQDLLHRNPTIGLNELYGKLKYGYNYKRNPVSLFRFLRKQGYYERRQERKSYSPKPYDTPLRLGIKWQLDVKFVPYECRVHKGTPFDMQLYQYTVMDEATRQRFIYPYKEQTARSTVDFILRAIKYFGYMPKTIQTDNGSEFTYTRQTKDGRTHLFDKFCNHYGIEHKKIKPRTPRHNGKVERSHRNDNERFYRHLKFYSFDDLVKQMSAYLERSNNIPISTLKSRDGKEKWLTPNLKRAELLWLDKGIVE